ncbi:preprotein translocase subunit SecA [Candidatus Roizmanbacteria bacterium]|nr:preprotein translocase subunit SecA [Candidatus Roizmanbacteria bacterium]
MLNIFKKFFDYNAREIDRIEKRVTEINTCEEKVRRLKDDAFTKETRKLQEDVQSGKSNLDEVLPFSYALVREAARRVIGEKHFDVQLIAGVSLHEGKIAEQKTGEGKTLSATTALYLNALEGKGVHLVTVNDYLARRDAGWMGAVFHFLGLKTAAIISDESFIFDPDFTDEKSQDWRLIHLRPISRKEAYLADVTYGINSEFGFDYLRDNMAQDPRELVQRGFHFAIIDEADSVLIDEARTPHIISAPYEEDTGKYYGYARIVKNLRPLTDYVIDEKLRTANLTDKGIQEVERILGVKNIYERDFDTLFHLEAALKAATLFKLDKDYIVKDQEVIIVDEFTGRLLNGRRFSEGLHQAIEAKENVAIQKESKTLATVSLQNYFRMYKKLAGMTGTAATEAEEFHKIYDVNVLTIPTHRPMVRRDEPDMIYKTEGAKFRAVVNDIAANYKVGRPVLVGTTSIEKNELLSRMLNEKGIPHQILNAKNHQEEATIIAGAGQKGVVTVATNMAGRGVDIILGGTPPSQYQTVKRKSQREENEYKKEYEKWAKNHDEVVRLGGLYVIGTERHESRRIDNQLRGRGGRQGDPGETRFFVALQDDLMRIFGGEQISRLMTFFNFPEDQPLTHAMVSKAIEQAQVKVEGFNFDIRKHLVDFDDVLNKQREIIYSLRKKILMQPRENPAEFYQTISGIFREEFTSIVNSLLLGEVVTDADRAQLTSELLFILPLQPKKIEDLAHPQNNEKLLQFVFAEFQKIYKLFEKNIGKELWSSIVSSVFLTTIDRYWMEHLTAIEELREGINLRGYAQLDPLVEYKNEAYSMFEKLVSSINYDVTRRLFKIEIQKSEPPPKSKIEPKKALLLKSASRVDPFAEKEKKEKQRVEGSPPVGQTKSPSPVGQPVSSVPPPGQFRVTPPGASQKRPGRNEPCWCGSGKKYKKCHWPD